MALVRSRRWVALALLALLGLVALAMLWLRAPDPSPARTATTSAAPRVFCTGATEAQAGPHPGMVWVPAGRYTPGDTVYAEEKPAGEVRVAGFWMDRTEVTNDEFARFVAATGHVTVAERPVDPRQQMPGMPADLLAPGAVVFRPPAQMPSQADPSQWWQYVPGANWRHPGGPGTGIEGRGAYPVVAITLEDAQAYARWKGHELPSEAQWEWAARGARNEAMASHEQPRDANTWQGPFPVRNAATDGFAGLAPVGCFPPNRLGLFDMIGNVWELTRDRFAPHGAEPNSSPRLRTGPSEVVIKGGSFLCSEDYCMRYRAGARQGQEPDLGTSHVGFRTVLLAPGPKENP